MINESGARASGNPVIILYTQVSIAGFEME